MCARERERCRKKVRSDFSVSRKEERRGSPHASPCDGNNFRREKMRGERERERELSRKRRGSPHASPCDGNNFCGEKMRGEREKTEGVGKKEEEERERKEKK